MFVYPWSTIGEVVGLWPGLWKFTSFDGLPGVVSKQIATQTEASEINPSHIWFYFYILSLLQIQWLFNKLKWSQYFPPPKGNQPWIFDAEAETPVLGHLIQSANSLEKDPDPGKDWRQEKGVTEDEMVRWHHQFHGHEFEQTPGDNEEAGEPGMLQLGGSQRVRHSLVTKHQQQLPS